MKASILGRWEIDRGPQNLHYDFWWNLPRDYMVTSEWGLPPQFENGIVPEDLLGNKYGHRIHFWDLRARRNVRRQPPFLFAYCLPFYRADSFHGVRGDFARNKGRTCPPRATRCH